MPEGANVPLPASTQTTPPAHTPNGSGTPRLSSFQEYEVGDDNPVETIKVVRSKKKAAGKKKRTTAIANSTA